MIRRAALLVLLPLSLSCSCASYERPTVEVTRVGIGDVSLSGVDVRVDLDMYNPNSRKLPLRTIDFELTVGDSDPMPGHGDLTQDLPPRSTTPVTVMVHVSPRAAISLGRQVAAGRSDYHVDGHVVASSWIGDVEVPFEKSGDVLGTAAGAASSAD